MLLALVDTSIQLAIVIAAVITVFFGYLVLTQIINLKRDKFRAEVYKEKSDKNPAPEERGAADNIIQILEKQRQRGDGDSK